MNLDLIIPAYNAHKVINRALYSIAVQRYISGLKVYIVNDCSEKDYQDEVDFFSNFFYIEEIKLSNNSGPGVARNVGIEKSSSDYIMFMDSDDYLYDPFAIINLYRNITNFNRDFVVSNFLLKRDGEISIRKKDLVWLHGKIYRRKFLEKNNIHFSNTRANEDNGFNRWVFLENPKMGYLFRLTYVYDDFKDSITRRNNRKFKFTGLEGYTYNMTWAMNKLIDKNKNLEEVAITSVGVLVAMYYYYLELYDQYKNQIEKICIWSKEPKKIYDKYKDKYIKDYIIDNFIDSKESQYEKINKFISFEEFLEKVDDVK